VFKDLPDFFIHVFCDLLTILCKLIKSACFNAFFSDLKLYQNVPLFIHVLYLILVVSVKRVYILLLKVLIQHDNGVSSIKCKQGGQLWLWFIVFMHTFFMLINESEI